MENNYEILEEVSKTEELKEKLSSSFLKMKTAISSKDSSVNIEKFSNVVTFLENMELKDLYVEISNQVDNIRDLKNNELNSKIYCISGMNLKRNPIFVIGLMKVQSLFQDKEITFSFVKIAKNYIFIIGCSGTGNTYGANIVNFEGKGKEDITIILSEETLYDINDLKVMFLDDEVYQKIFLDKEIPVFLLINPKEDLNIDIETLICVTK